MRIGIYIEPASPSLGGAEVSVALLAAALDASGEDVEIIHHRCGLTPETLGEFSGTALGRVRLRYVAPGRPELGDSRLPWRRYREARAWHAEYSAPYDVFVNVTHSVPPFCHAKYGALLVLFPMFTPLHHARGRGGGLRRRVGDAYSRWEWRRRMASYATILAISEYTRHWTRELWDVDADIVYPPAPRVDPATAKQARILSVGRITRAGVNKCQLEITHAFAEMALPGWQYVTAGAVGRSAGDAAYVDEIRRAGEGHSVTVATNLGRDAIRDYYATSKIFWHAAGFANTADRPDLNEHFGMTTVEAMSAGCVPVVFNGGGQREIVEHGVNGFLWNTLDELRSYTRALAADEARWATMSTAAIKRAAQFAPARYVDNFLRHLRPGLGRSPGTSAQEAADSRV